MSNKRLAFSRRRSQSLDVARIGDIVTLPIARISNIGVFLEDEDLGEVFLPKNEFQSRPNEGDELEVFLYRDSEDRPIATLNRPRVLPGQFGVLKVISSTGIGAFLDWGLRKDLLLPFREQKGKPEKGKPIVVYVYVDETSDRIVASQRIGKYLGETLPDVGEGDEVDLILFGKTEMGYKAIVNGAHSGLLFANEVFKKLYYADEIKGYVKEVRPDRKIDLSLYPVGQRGVDDLEQQIEDELEKRGGFWGIDDKTPADEIYRELGVSKKVFKKTTGAMFRKRRLIFEDGGIRRVQD